MRQKSLLILFCVVMLLTSCGVSAEERNNTGNNRIRDENYAGALLAYQAAQVDAPDQPEPYYNAASAYLGAGELEHAAAALEQALKTADEALTAKAYYNLGNVYFQMGDYESAYQAYQQVLLLRPDDADARYNLELCLLYFRNATSTAIQQQTEPESDQTDPSATPTNQPGGLDGPTPTPPSPPLSEADLSQTPASGEAANDGLDSQTPMPNSQGAMTAEQAARLLDSIQQDQQTLREYLQNAASDGEPADKDW